MGIKFHCPNGHKLNVKAFLAGKRGICPKCGTKMLIPTVSESGLVDSDVEETDPSHAAAKSNGSGAVVATAPAASAPAAPAVSAAPAAVGATAGNDPIADAPAAIWYVRPPPPNVGQYGPARGEVMRKWISEGRVSSDSLVWREGWTDWQTAGKIFPSLNESGTHAAAPAVSTTVPLSPRSSQRTAARYETKKHDSNAMAIAILVGLGILCLILIGILVFVVTRMNQAS